MDTKTSNRYRLVVPSTRIYVSPEMGAHTDTQILFGEEVEILEGVGEYTKVHALTDRKTGWARMTRVQFEPASVLVPVTHKIALSRAPIFCLPDAKSLRIAVLSMNSLISAGRTATHNGEEFTRVQCFANGTAWIRSSHLRLLGEPATDFVSVMESFIGTLYGWGERDAYPGIDCSALLLQALVACGWTSCPRDTVDQVEELGDELEQGAHFVLQRGDLIFWKGHVAVMIDLERCIHATDVAPYHCVVIQRLSDVVEQRMALGLGPITRVRRFPEYNAK